jgi:hypothetical protein
MIQCYTDYKGTEQDPTRESSLDYWVYDVRCSQVAQMVRLAQPRHTAVSKTMCLLGRLSKTGRCALTVSGPQPTCSGITKPGRPSLHRILLISLVSSGSLASVINFILHCCADRSFYLSIGSSRTLIRNCTITEQLHNNEARWQNLMTVPGRTCKRRHFLTSLERQTCREDGSTKA